MNVNNLGLNYFVPNSNSADNVVALTHLWEQTVGSKKEVAPSVFAAYYNYAYADQDAEEGYWGDGEVFIDLHFGNGVLTVSPDEARRIARSIIKRADFLDGEGTND